ncbi:MAG: sigma-54 dependent transcriptional regulator [Thermodesulfobacteriota bacterium]|nr:sigma-54 dependent transcriptional regulator [Thermodesulfobacteriota bacterium]
MAHILIVEDDINLGQVLFQELKSHNHDMELVGDAEAALARIDKYVYDLILTDLKLPGRDGIEILKQARESSPTTLVIVMTGYASVDTAVIAMKNGAQDFIQKPFGLHEIVVKIDDALKFKRMKNEIDYLRHAQDDVIYRTRDIIGNSTQTRKVLKMVEKVSMAGSTVLITGETGVGKGLIAGAIHHNSDRADNNFVQVNCAALPQHILESELFGHEKGAFTGAIKMRTGRVEQANMGTIFMDEIGDMDIALQAKILRVLEEREIERLGGDKTIKVDVRVIAATNQDLASLVRQGKFREDLYYRINVVNLHIQPLKNRRDDIEPLVRYFVRKYGMEFNKDEMAIDPDAMEMLLKYDWPGNVREIRNCVERAILLSEGKVITADDIFLAPVSDVHTATDHHSGQSSLSTTEKDKIIEALEANDWIQKDAAGQLGISKRVMHYKIQKHGITHPRWIKNR